MPPYCSCGVIRVSGSPDIGFETRSLTTCFNVHWYLPTRCIQGTLEMLTSANLATSGGLLGIQHSGNYLVSSRIWMSELTDTWMTPHEQYGGMLSFFCCFIRSEDRSLMSSIVLDSAATLFTPETPKVLCGLNHFKLPLHWHKGE